MEPGLQEAQIMICLMCRQAEIVDSLTLVSFQRSEMHMLVDNVPARVCPNCGEAYVGEEVAVRLLQSVDEMYNAGVLDGYYQYHPA
jgi:YgiT-type zinc finger domain-containing protein